MIQHLFNKSIVIKRLKATSGNKRQMTSTGTYDAHIQRLDEHTTPAAVNVYAATHKAWVDISASINDGDEVLGPDGTRYSVVAVIDKEPDIAINEHREILLQRYSS